MHAVHFFISAHYCICRTDLRPVPSKPSCAGRLSFLVDENAHAVHFFISALLQLLDRAGSLYGEVARFVLRVIFRRSRLKKTVEPMMLGGPGGGGGAGGPMEGHNGHMQQQQQRALMQGQAGQWAPPLAGSQGAPGSGPWDGLWGAR